MFLCVNRLFIHLSNLFNGDKKLGSTINKFLNENVSVSVIFCLIPFILCKFVHFRNVNSIGFILICVHVIFYFSGKLSWTNWSRRWERLSQKLFLIWSIRSFRNFHTANYFWIKLNIQLYMKISFKIQKTSPVQNNHKCFIFKPFAYVYSIKVLTSKIRIYIYEL